MKRGTSDRLLLMLIENSSFPSSAVYKYLDLKFIPGPATQHEFGEIIWIVYAWPSIYVNEDNRN